MKLHEGVLKTAHENPNSIAIYYGDERISYEELNLMGQLLVKKLKEKGVKAGDRVALWSEKSPWVIAAMQAVLRLGAAYVPLDPMCPISRAKTILNDCQVRVLMTTQDRANKVLADNRGEITCLPFPLSIQGEAISTSVPDRGFTEASFSVDQLAYILYTSGSTGVPKGVCLSHKNAMAFVNWAGDILKARATDRFSNHAPFHFDLSVLDLYVPFFCGASVTIIPEGISYSPRKLVDFIQKSEITCWYSVPSALILMMEHGGLMSADLKSLRAVLFAGEPFPIKHLRRLRAHLSNVRFLNLYGPTETNVCTYHEVGILNEDQISPVPIGQACCGDEVWAVKSDGVRVSNIGEEGELIVRGPTVMLGYWGKMPVSDQTYATGDIVRLAGYSEKGIEEFQFIGRRDHQVKVKGYRVDLGEVEAVLLRSPDIVEVAVLALGSGLQSSLMACVMTRNGKTPGLLELKKLCSEFLPTYMIIDGIRFFTEFPRTSTGKTDRKALFELLNEKDALAA